MIKIIKLLAVPFIFINVACAGPLFDVTSDGTPLVDTLKIDVCLNVNGGKAIGCQTFTVTNGTLHINTTIPNRTYNDTGLKILNKAYDYSIPASLNGYSRLGTVSDTQEATGTISGPVSYNVTPSGDVNLTITPNSAQSVHRGASASFVVTPSNGYAVSNSVGGTCPTGAWSGSTYSTGAVLSACTVTFTSVIGPSVTGIIPNTGPITGGSIVSIKGTNFTNSATVLFGSTPATSVTFISATSMTAVAPSNTAGIVDVRVTASGASSAITTADKFTYGTQTIYLTNKNDTNIFNCIPSSTGGIVGACTTVNGTSALSDPNYIAVTTINGTQYVYITNKIAATVTQCVLTSRNTFSDCKIAANADETSVAFNSLAGISFVTINSIQYAYLSGIDASNFGIIYRCTITASGVNTGNLTCAAAHTTGTPPWAYANGTPQHILFKSVNGVLYAYVSNNNNANTTTTSNVYQCQMTTAGYFDITTCSSLFGAGGIAKPVTNFSPAQISNDTVDATYNNVVYIGQSIDSAAVSCLIDTSTGKFTSCASFYSAGGAGTTGVQIASITGTPILYLQDNTSNGLYYCSLATISPYNMSTCSSVTAGSSLAALASGTTAYVINN